MICLAFCSVMVSNFEIRARVLVVEWAHGCFGGVTIIGASPQFGILLWGEGYKHPKYLGSALGSDT